MLIIELVVGAILLFPAKERYISKILTLDVRVQSELMELITKIFKKIDQDVIDNEPDLQALKHENRNLRLQIEDLNNTLQEIAYQNETLTNEKKELTLQKKKLEESETKRLRRFTPELNLSFLEIEVNKKTDIIEELNTRHQELLKKYESEVSQLQDELDSANNKLIDYKKIKGDIELYKKKIEDLAPYKKRTQELQTSNQNLFDELKQLEKESMNIGYTQSQLRTYKEQMESFKAECEILKERLNNSENLYKEAIKNKKELEDAKNFFEIKSRELNNELDRIKTRTDKEEET